MLHPCRRFVPWLALAGVALLGAALSGVACTDKSGSSTAGSHRSGRGADAAVVARVKSTFSTIVVWDDGDYRCLAFGKRTAIQSCVNRGNKLDFRFEYVRMMLAAVALRPEPRRILVLGLGGAALPTLVARLYPNVRMDVVEIDPGVLKVAKRHLYYQPTPHTKLHLEDAFKFVTRAADAPTPPQYDVIWVDCFDAKHIPKHLMTDRFVTGLRRILHPAGVLAANLWSTHPSYPTSVKRYKRLFSEVWRMAGHKSSNHALVALRRPLTTPPAELAKRTAALDKQLPLPLPLLPEIKRLKKVQ